jgi:hypothetical protein
MQERKQGGPGAKSGLACKQCNVGGEKVESRFALPPRGLEGGFGISSFNFCRRAQCLNVKR